jgi:hypothetical protein
MSPLDPLDGAAVEQAWLGQAVEGTNPGREIIEGGQVSEIALVTSEEISRRSIRL